MAQWRPRTPERAANAAADFERAEVMDEREAEIEHQIAQEFNPSSSTSVSLVAREWGRRTPRDALTRAASCLRVIRGTIFYETCRHRLGSADGSQRIIAVSAPCNSETMKRGIG